MEKFKIKDYKSEITDWTQYEPLKLKEAVICKCLECSVYDRTEVKKSNCYSCPLYQFKEKYFNKNNIFKINN